MFKKHVDMLSGPITKGLFTMTLPIMIMNVIQSLFTLIDMTVLNTFGSDPSAVGSVGACGVLITLITGLLVGISTGSTVIIARFLGQNDSARTEKAAGTSIFLALIGGAILFCVGLSCSEFFLNLTNCPPSLLPKASLYFKLYFAGSPILILTYFFASNLNAQGDSTRPMIFSVLGGVAKIVFDFIFIYLFKMSVEGVACATIISWIVTASLSFSALYSSHSNTRIQFSKIRPYFKEIKEILAIGIPAGVEQAAYAIANVIIAATVNSFGAAATTGISIANIFDGILYNISVAPAVAVTAFVSQNIGNNNVKRATKSIFSGILITVSLGATIGALSAIFAPQLSSIMSSDPEAIAFSAQKMVIVSSTYFICGIYHIIGGGLRGIKKPLSMTISTLLFMCVLRFVWVYLIFPLVPNLTFLYLVWPIGWVLCIITMLFVLIPEIRKLKKEMT
ncbi:MAG: MATE family efflux transporter [Clostridia bacterium]|nr:MATE family efflux transporter [Clostridia bacterium]